MYHFFCMLHLVCLDCYQTCPDRVSDARERDRNMAVEFAEQLKEQ